MLIYLVRIQGRAAVVSSHEPLHTRQERRRVYKSVRNVYKELSTVLLTYRDLAVSFVVRFPDAKPLMVVVTPVGVR